MEPAVADIRAIKSLPERLINSILIGSGRPGPIPYKYHHDG